MRGGVERIWAFSERIVTRSGTQLETRAGSCLQRVKLVSSHLVLMLFKVCKRGMGKKKGQRHDEGILAN